MGSSPRFAERRRLAHQGRTRGSRLLSRILDPRTRRERVLPREERYGTPKRATACDATHPLTASSESVRRPTTTTFRSSVGLAGMRVSSPQFRLELPELLRQRRCSQGVPPPAQHLAYDRLVLLTNRTAVTQMAGSLRRSEPIQPRNQLVAQLLRERDFRDTGVEVDRQAPHPTPIARFETNGPATKTRGARQGPAVVELAIRGGRALSVTHGP